MLSSLTIPLTSEELRIFMKEDEGPTLKTFGEQTNWTAPLILAKSTQHQGENGLH